jgi:hypothetical protein
MRKQKTPSSRSPGLRCQDLLLLSAPRTSQQPVLADAAAIRAVPAPAQIETGKQRITSGTSMTRVGQFGVSSKFM